MRCLKLWHGLGLFIILVNSKFCVCRFGLSNKFEAEFPSSLTGKVSISEEKFGIGVEVLLQKQVFQVYSTVKIINCTAVVLVCFVFNFPCRLHLKNSKPASVELTVVLRRIFQLMCDGYYVDAFAAAAL